MKGYLSKKLRDWQLWHLGRKFYANREFRLWTERPVPGAPPPHVVKERIVEQYAEAFCPTILIETGTYLGDMVWAMRHRFLRIISIELSERLSDQARKRFSQYSNVEVVCGDSGTVLQQVLSEIRTPCLFWLDGHYSGGSTACANTNTPVQRELEAIFAHSIEGHAILIDDARCFNGGDGYPSIDEVHRNVAGRFPDYAFSVRNDVIRIHPDRPVHGTL